MHFGLGHRSQLGDDQSPGVQRPLPRQRDELFDERTQFLGLLDRRNDPFVAKQRQRQVALQRQTMRRIAVQFAAGFSVSHGSILVRWFVEVVR